MQTFLIILLGVAVVVMLVLNLTTLKGRMARYSEAARNEDPRRARATALWWAALVVALISALLLVYSYLH